MLCLSLVVVLTTMLLLTCPTSAQIGMQTMACHPQRGVVLLLQPACLASRRRCPCDIQTPLASTRCTFKSHRSSYVYPSENPHSTTICAAVVAAAAAAAALFSTHSRATPSILRTNSSFKVLDQSSLAIPSNFSVPRPTMVPMPVHFRLKFDTTLT